jgi:hypothetical protein
LPVFFFFLNFAFESIAGESVDLPDDTDTFAECGCFRRKQSPFDTISDVRRPPAWNNKRSPVWGNSGPWRILQPKGLARLFRHPDVTINSCRVILPLNLISPLGCFLLDFSLQGDQIVSERKNNDSHPTLRCRSTGSWPSDFTVALSGRHMRRMSLSFPLVVQYRLSHLWRSGY